MSTIDDSQSLRSQQYRDSSNLEKRASLHERFSANPQGWFSWLTDHLQALPDPASLLEVGCGPGLLWQSQSTRLPAAWRVTLSDFSPGMLGQARTALSGQERAYQWAVADAQALPFPSASFDGLIANHMLYHVPDRPRALAEMRRVLRPGGWLFAATNGQAYMQELHQWVARAALTTENGGADLLWSGLPFNLENGAAQILAHFPSLELFKYIDALEVTEAEPLLRYVQSMQTYGNQAQIQAALPRLRQLWEEEIKTRGAVHIGKASGLFVARVPN